MKKLLLSLIPLLILGIVTGEAQCIPDTSITQVGLSPPDSTLACIQQGVYYDVTIHFKNFDLIDGGALGFPGFTLVMDSVRLDSISNLPAGLTYECQNGDCTYQNSENGCIRITGLTSAPPGDYQLGFYATVTISSPLALTIPVDSATLANAGLGYELTVIEAGTVCSNTFSPGPLSVSTSVSGLTEPTVCEGDTAIIAATPDGGNPPYNFNWDQGVNLSDSAAPNPKVFPGNAGTYQVTVTDNAGATVTGSIGLNYTTLPSVTVVPQDTTICLGSVVQLMTTGGISYQWSPGDGLSDGNIADPVANPTETTTYRVTVEDQNCANTDSITITVDDSAPSASFNFNATGLAVSFTSFSTGDHFWDFGDGGTSTIKNPGHLYAQGGIYEVQLIVVGDCNADTTSKTIDLTSTSILQPDQKSFIIAPNPNRGIFFIELNRASSHEITIRTIEGKELLKQTIAKRGRTGFNLSGEPRGIYFLQINDGENSITEKLIIK